MHRYEDYYHYVRNDKTVSQAHEGTIEIGDLVLEHGETYFLTVRARNDKGYVTKASSPNVLIDLTPPNPGPAGDLQLDVMYADRCQAAPSQRCVATTMRPNHRIVKDGPGNAAIFNGATPIYDEWYTRYHTFLAGVLVWSTWW